MESAINPIVDLKLNEQSKAILKKLHTQHSALSVETSDELQTFVTITMPSQQFNLFSAGLNL